ncbi:MAG: carboxypeptidase regulatory-like domain-containing protein [Vicinamibacterales bacterium]
MRIRLLVLAVVLLAALPAAAQEQTGSIQGVVRDASGGVLPGVTVEARSLGQAGAVTATTDAEGVYRFPALAPGRYVLTASLQGFTEARVSEVTLLLGQILTVPLTLQVAGVAETVQVTAESPLIDVKQNATFATVTLETIDRIPKGRDFTGVIAAAPGANSESRAGGISVDGASGSENRFVVDGVDTTNLRTGASGKTYVTDFVQEVQVKTSGYNAEYPGATGGVVNALTKSGTNVFRGSAGFYYTNNGPSGVENKDKGSFWVGKQRPSLRLKPTKTTEAEYYTVPLNVSPEWSPVFEAGGPIIRDRLWYWAGYAPVRTYSKRTVTWRTPRPGGPATETFKQDQPYDRLTVNATWQVSNSLRAKFTAAPEWYRQRGTLPTIEPDGTSTGNAATEYAVPGENRWNDAYSGLVDWVVRPTFYVNVSGGYFMTDTETIGNGTEIRHSMDGNISDFPEVPASLIQPSGYVDNRSSSKTVTDKYTRTYVNVTGTWFKSGFLGQHAIKGGVRFERIGNTRNVGAIQPTITFHWNAAYTKSTGEELRGKYGFYDVSRGVLGVGDIHSNNWGLFIQDSWSPNAKLTINAGVRAESERIPFYTPGEEQNGIVFGFGDKVAPRLGFAYDIKGDGKWKAYGSFGRFFDIMKLEMPRGSLGGEQWMIYNYSLDTYDWKSINCQENDPKCPGTLFEAERLRFGSNEPNNPDALAVMPKYFGAPRNLLMDDMKPMQSQEFILGLDREMTRTTSVGVRYVKKWVTQVIEDFGWNENGTEYYFIGNPGRGYQGELQFLWGTPNPETGYTPPALYKPINGKVYPQVKPVRDYDSVEFTFKKRLANRWSATATYQWSRLWGNYPGLASSDEAGSGTARLSPNVNRLYDGPWMMYDTKGNQVLGPLNTDRPHHFKAQATYDLPWGTGVGLFWYIRSGALFSKYITYQGYGWVFYDGRGSLGRTPVEQRADLLLQHDFRLGSRATLNVNLNVTNLFDNDVAISMYDSQFRDSFGFTPIENFFIPWDPVAVAMAGAQRPDARFYGGVAPTKAQGYGNPKPMDRIFMGRREVRFGASIRF